MLHDCLSMRMVCLLSSTAQGPDIVEGLDTVLRFLHLTGLLVHYNQDVPKWKGDIPTPLDIQRAGVTTRRGLQYAAPPRIPGFGSGHRTVSQSGALLSTVFLEVAVAASLVAEFCVHTRTLVTGNRSASCTIVTVTDAFPS